MNLICEVMLEHQPKQTLEAAEIEEAKSRDNNT